MGEQRGAAEVTDYVRGTSGTFDKNGAFIKLTLAVLMTPERLRSANCCPS
jgi:hypothetical protein